MRHRGDSRPAIPDDNAPVAPAHSPTRWTVRRVRSIAFVLFGLAVAASLVSVYLTYRYAQESSAQAKNSSAQAAAVDRRLSVLEQDLAERTQQRNAERDAASQEQERFRANLCVVLGELSASPGLDTIRATLHCTQPGVTEPSTPGGQPTTAPPTRSSAPSSPASSAPTPVPAESTPSPSPTPAPATPAPARSPLCGLLPIC